MNKHGSIVVTYPPWVEERVSWHERLASDEDKMKLVLGLVLENRRRGTGGPFAAAIFQQHENRLVSIGLSMVLSTKCPLGHAPNVAISKACEAENTHDLGLDENKRFEIFLNCEPCTGCAHFILVSGIRRVVYAASGKVKERIGMEQGVQPLAHLRECGIEVVSGVLANDAKRLIEESARSDEPPYNPRRDE